MIEAVLRADGHRVCARYRAGHGGAGYMQGSVVEMLARDAKLLQIGGGTDESQIFRIAREALAYLVRLASRRRGETGRRHFNVIGVFFGS